MNPAFHKFQYMNAPNMVPLAVVTAAVLTLPAVAAQDSSVPTARLPDNEAQAKARSALRHTTQAPATTAMDPTASSEAFSEELVVSTLPGPQPDNEAQARARAALRQGWGAMEPEPVAAVEDSTVVIQAVPVAPAEPSARSGDTHPLAAEMTSPALPLTAAQQRQLDALLEAYRLDQLSASEYHQRRAQVLTGN